VTCGRVRVGVGGGAGGEGGGGGGGGVEWRTLLESRRFARPGARNNLERAR